MRAGGEIGEIFLPADEKNHVTKIIPDDFQVSLRGGQLEGRGPDRVAPIDVKILWDDIISIIGPRRKGGNTIFIPVPGTTQS